MGTAVLKGESALLKRIEKLLKAELSVSWSRAERDTKTEGWGTVHLDDPRQAHALDRMFSFDLGPMRALPPSATFAPDLGAGRIESDTREVTDDVTLQARLSKLHAARSANTSFYELRTSVDGRAPSRALMGVARSRFRGDVTDTERNESAVLWYDLDTLEPNVSMSLGPEKRLMTTTRETINDVIAAQSALGLDVKGRIEHPEPYLQLGALGNYGRTEENGRFALSPDGVKRVGAAPKEKLVAPTCAPTGSTSARASRPARTSGAPTPRRPGRRPRTRRTTSRSTPSSRRTPARCASSLRRARATRRRCPGSRANTANWPRDATCAPTPNASSRPRPSPSTSTA